MGSSFAPPPVSSFNGFAPPPASAYSGQATSSEPEQSAISKFWSKANPVANWESLGNTIYNLAMHPGQTLTQIGENNDIPRQRAVEAFKNGNYGQGIIHGLYWLANAIPGFGTALDTAGVEAQHGDYAGAIADTAGTIAQMEEGRLAPTMLTKAGEAAVVAPTAIKSGIKAAAPGVIGGTAKAGLGLAASQAVGSVIPEAEWPLRIVTVYPGAHEIVRALRSGVNAAKAAVAEGAPAAPAAVSAVPDELMDLKNGIAQGFKYKNYASAPPEAQATIDALANRTTQNEDTAAPTPKPAGWSKQFAVPSTEQVSSASQVTAESPGLTGTVGADASVPRETPPASEPPSSAAPAATASPEATPAAQEPAAGPSLAPPSKVVTIPPNAAKGLEGSRIISEDGAQQFANDNGLSLDDATKALINDGITVLGRSELNRALHGIGNELGLDHDALSDAAKIQFRVKSLTQLSQDQMLDLYENLINKRSASEPLPTKGEMAARTEQPVSGSLASNPRALVAAQALKSELEKPNGGNIPSDGGQTNVQSQSGTGAATQGAQASEPIPSGSGAGTGDATQVFIPGEGRSFPATYKLRELTDIQASHNGVTFGRNSDYPYTNDRDYTKADNQGKIITGSSQFQPAFHLTDNPDATNGPPLIDQDGNVIGGNGRTMTLQRVYRYSQAGADAYKAMLAKKAAQFGIDPGQVAAMKQPVLVREISNEDLGNAQNAVTDFNKTGTAELRPSERAIADSRRVSQSTLNDIGRRLDDAGPDATLAQVTEGKAGGEVLNRLIDDGVISPQERAAYASGDTLTPDGRARISKLLLGRFFRDPSQFDTLPTAIKNKLERIAPSLASVEPLGQWNLTPTVQQGIDMLEDARQHGMLKNLDEFSRQNGLLSSESYSPDALRMAKILQSMPQRQIVNAISRYVEDAQHYSKGPGLFGEQTMDPQLSLSDAIENTKGGASGQ